MSDPRVIFIILIIIPIVIFILQTHFYKLQQKNIKKYRNNNV